MPTIADTIMGRMSPILAKRSTQLRRNRLAFHGGRPYIDERLWRAPNESDLSWNGDASIRRLDPLLCGNGQSFGMVGRKDRTTYVNDAGRIVLKIQQYLFKEETARDGAPPEVLANIGGRGVDATSFWMAVSEELTVGQWLWVQASRAEVAGTLAERSASDAIRWTIYRAKDVVDWSFDAAGELQWLIVETCERDASDPFSAPVERAVRTLWRRTAEGVEVSRFERAGIGQAREADSQTLPLEHIPFVLIGAPSDDPWWFDDVEQIQCQLLNIDSLHTENLTRTVFPQLVISEGTYNSLQTHLVEQYGAENGEVSVKAMKEIIRGADAPLVESPDESGTSRYLMPSAADLSAMPTEIERKRRLLFDMTGLSLFNKESRQVQTAESKQFDQLDTESTLKNRAIVLQKAEERLVAVSRELDPTFPDYSPVWPSSFDVVDAAADMQTVTMLENLPDITPSMRKLVMKTALRIVKAMHGADQKLVEDASREIDEMDFSAQDAPSLEDLAGGSAFGEDGV